MDVWTLIAGLAVIIGIAAGIVQILDYLQKRREEKRQPLAEEAAAPSPPAPAVPSNLPPRGEFIGREKEKARVMEGLVSRWSLTCIDGIGGIGKTALALEVAGECLLASKGEIPADGIPTFDGFIWTTAKDRELALNDVLDAIARTLDYPGIAQQLLEEKQESVCKLLQTKPYLLIVDNFQTVMDEAVRDFLLRLPEPSKALITSREQRPRQAWAVSLKGMEQAEALTLIRSEGRRLELASVEKGEEGMLLRLYKATGAAPLAIKWAVGQIKQKGQSLDTVLAALHEARGDIFEKVFARSWSLLTDEARRILMVMPIFATSASKAAIEAASDMHHYALDEGLGQLVEMWLVEASEELDAAKRRYSIHPLTRAFAQSQLDTTQLANIRPEVKKRMAVYFLGFVRGRRRKAFPEIELDIANIREVVVWCDRNKRWDMVIEFVRSLYLFFETRGHWDLAIDLGQRAVDAARELELPAEEAYHNRYLLAWFHYQLGDYENAVRYSQLALEIFSGLGDKGDVANCHRLLGKIALKRAQLDEDAEYLLEEAKEHLLGEAWTWLESLTDEWEALLPLAEDEDKRVLVRNLQQFGYLLSDRGDLSRALGNLKEALAWYRRSYDFHSRIPDEYLVVPHERGIVSVLDNLADAERESGDIHNAREHYDELLWRSKELGQRRGISHAYRGLGLVAECGGDLTQASALLRKAQDEYRRLDAKKELQETQTALSRVEHKLAAGDSGAAGGGAVSE